MLRIVLKLLFHVGREVLSNLYFLTLEIGDLLRVLLVKFFNCPRVFNVVSHLNRPPESR